MGAIHWTERNGKRLWRGGRLALVLGAGMLVSASVFGQLNLERKFNEGDSYRTTHTVNLRQALKLGPQESKTQARNEMKSRTQVGKRQPDGSIKIREELTGFSTTLALPGGNVFSFDSGKPEKQYDPGSFQAVLKEAFEALAKSQYTAVIGPSNKVLRVEVDEKVWADLSTQARQMVKDQLAPDQLKRGLQQDINKLPGKPVRVGDAWERTEVLNLGSGQSMEFKMQYTYKGTAELEGRPVHQIGSEVLAVTFAIAQASPLPVRLKGANLKVQSSAGTLSFDEGRGQFVQQEAKVHVVGPITLIQGPQEVAGTLDLLIEGRSETSF